MARSISLSDEAFRVLRGEKREGESDSDVVLRLANEAHKKRKDPMKFLKNPPEAAWDWETYETFRERMRQADIDRARALGLLPPSDEPSDGDPDEDGNTVGG